MPRVGMLPQDGSEVPGDIGRAILRHFDLPPDATTFYSEPNGQGLFLALKTETVQKRAIVWDAGSSKKKLDPAEQLKLLLDSIPSADRSNVLDSLGLMERPGPQTDPRLPITSVFELESIFANPEPVEYLIEPEIPAESVVYLAGVPESGKSTLACAWGRDLAAKGHPVLLLDRDRNPRSVIRDRLERLGIKGGNSRFWVWDSRQKSEPPQPDSRAVIDWARRTRLETGKRPLVIVDSTVSFLLPGEDENSSKDIRALFNRCRAVCDVGGSVVLLHHPGKGGDIRGSSDFGAAADQGFIVTNSAVGEHRLCRLTLKVHKTRYALSVDLVYSYEGGKMVRRKLVPAEPERGDGQGTPDDVTARTLREVLRANPGIGSRQFEKIAHERGMPHNKARSFLKEGVDSGNIRVRLVGRKKEHFLCDE